jgi:hypothetical protein
MKTTRLVLLILGLGISPLVSSADEKAKPAADEEGFVSMFDGKTLKGWEEMPATDKKAWSVKDGIIVGEGGEGRGYLVYEKRDIADFEMKFSYRFPKAPANSGVNIRASKDKTGKRKFQAYHVDIGHVGIGKKVPGAWDFHTPGRKEHSCFRGDRLVIDKDDKPTVTKIEGAITAEEINKGGWNEVHVIVKGNRFKFSINGKPASEFTEHLPESKRLDKGMIQLQLHDPGMIVEYKNLRIKIDRPVGAVPLNF